MPRRSQNESGRKKPSRSPGGSKPGKGTPAKRTSAKTGSIKTGRKFGKKVDPASAKPSRPQRFSQTSRFSKSGRSEGDENSGRSRRNEPFGKPFKKAVRKRPPKAHSQVVHRRHAQVSEEGTKSDKIRLNKFIANAGVSSRREADELIKMGLISVNGKVVSELGYKVSPGDQVRYEDRVLKAEKPVYILMNKPKGFITTTDDPHERKTIMHIIGSAVKQRIYPVGRLDRNTTGLLLLTNDGDLADQLMHPSFNVRKVYKVELDRPLTKGDFQKIVDGVHLEEGRAIVDDLAIVSEDGRTVGIELHIGWNRVVRRIFESLDYEVLKLDRTVYAGLDKKDLARGQWRFLTKQEIIQLKHFK